MSKSNTLRYRGYTTTIHYSTEDVVLYGKIDGINDLVTFNSINAIGIVDEFHKAVDEYIAICKHQGKDPDRPYLGTFNVRIRPELHRQLSVMAKENGRTLNAEVEIAIEHHIKGR